MPENNVLHNFAKAGDLAEVQSQVSNFDINAKGQYDETALVKAAEYGRTDVVKFLLTLNADVNIPSVSKLKIISVHPSYLLYTLLFSTIVMYCHHS